MHNLTKIRIFRVLLALSWLPSLLLLYPFALLRRKLSEKHIFLFDRYSLGGAQRVHIDILASIPAEPKLVLFTRRSPNDVMKAAFEAIPNTECRDIHFWCDNLLFRLFTVHYWAFYLNRHKGLRVLSSNSTFFYDLLLWLRSDFLRMELIHNFTYGKKGMEFFGLANHLYLDKRLTVDYATAQNILEQYAANGIDPVFNQRIEVMEPGVYIPDELPMKDKQPLKVLYAGRGGPQKRVWLIDRIATQCYNTGWPVIFHFAGDLNTELSEFVTTHSIIYGQISDAERMKAVYAESHVILLTSAYEGFPMVIKEGMAQGCIPVVTALPGNKTHLRSGENALLIEAVEDESAIVSDALKHISKLAVDLELRSRLQSAAEIYARKHFSRTIFFAAYRSLLLDQ